MNIYLILFATPQYTLEGGQFIHSWLIMCLWFTKTTY